jgi:hypothetical protein
MICFQFEKESMLKTTYYCKIPALKREKSPKLPESSNHNVNGHLSRE